MGKRKTAAGNTKKRKTEVVFDESKRRDFLTGFRKRKDERRKKAREQMETKLKQEIKEAKEKAKKDIQEAKSSSHRIIPEIEHLLEKTFPTDVHDLGSHTVSVTHLDLSKKPAESSDDENEVEDEDNEEEIDAPKPEPPKKSKKALQKVISKSMDRLGQLKEVKSKTTGKGKKSQKRLQGKKTMKSKRAKFFHPKKIVA